MFLIVITVGKMKYFFLFFFQSIATAIAFGYSTVLYLRYQLLILVSLFELNHLAGFCYLFFAFNTIVLRFLFCVDFHCCLL